MVCVVCARVCVKEREKFFSRKELLALLYANYNSQGRAMSDLFEGNKRLFTDSEILLQYCCLPQGDKHVLGFYSEAV